jgi:drug/metabolite transporter (DMT)-like permease
MERWLVSERHVRLCAVLGPGTIAFSSILVRLSHASPSTAAISRCAYALPVLGLLAWLEDRRHGRRVWAQRRVAVLSGVFFAGDLVLWHTSIEYVGAGLATMIVLVGLLVATLPEQVLRFGTDQRARTRAVIGPDVALGTADEHDRL